VVVVVVVVVVATDDSPFDSISQHPRRCIAQQRLQYAVVHLLPK